jgi:hypothetical protein
MKRIISALLIAATLGFSIGNTNFLFAQGTGRYQRFKGTTSDGICDGSFNRLLNDPDPLRESYLNEFDDGFVYKGLFDGQSAEVLAVSNTNYDVCRYFRTPNGIVHKILMGVYRQTGKYFLIYNGKEAKLLTMTLGGSYNPVKPVSFIDSKGIKHTIVIYKERIPNP